MIYVSIFIHSYLLETCDLQLFNETLNSLLNELKSKPSSAVMHKKVLSAEANATSMKSKNVIVLFLTNLFHLFQLKLIFKL